MQCKVKQENVHIKNAKIKYKHYTEACKYV